MRDGGPGFRRRPADLLRHGDHQRRLSDADGILLLRLSRWSRRLRVQGKCRDLFGDPNTITASDMAGPVTCFRVVHGGGGDRGDGGAAVLVHPCYRRLCWYRCCCCKGGGGADVKVFVTRVVSNCRDLFPFLRHVRLASLILLANGFFMALAPV